MDIPVMGTAIAHQIYKVHVANGGSKDGTQGILQTYEKLANTTVPAGVPNNEK